jgi:opacity protein-like surface antigen
MRIATCVFLGAALLALTPSTAGAQGKPVHVNFGGGPTLLFGDLGEHFNTGWGPAVGVTFQPGRFGFQFEYAYRWFNVDEDLPVFGATAFSANHQTHQLDFNVVVNLTPPDSPVRFFAVAGPGAYHREVEITEYVGTGVICDPFWYVCGTFPVEAVVGSRGGWDFGFNIGAGVGFALGESAEFYVETRYHYVGGPEIPADAIAGAGGSTSGNYLPITFGFRF